MATRLSSLLRELGIGADTAIKFLANAGHQVKDQNAKLTQEQEDILFNKYASQAKKEERKRQKEAEAAAAKAAEEKKAAEAKAPEQEPAPATPHRLHIVGKLDENGEVVPNPVESPVAPEPVEKEAQKKTPAQESVVKPSDEEKVQPKPEKIEEARPAEPEQVETLPEKEIETKQQKVVEKEQVAATQPDKKAEEVEEKVEKAPAAEPKKKGAGAKSSDKELSGNKPEKETKSAPVVEANDDKKKEKPVESTQEPAQEKRASEATVESAPAPALKAEPAAAPASEPEKEETEIYRIEHAPALNIKTVGKIDLDALNQSTRPAKNDHRNKNKNDKNRGKQPQQPQATAKNDARTEVKGEVKERKRIQNKGHKVDIAQEIANNNQTAKSKNDKRRDDKRRDAKPVANSADKTNRPDQQNRPDQSNRRDDKRRDDRKQADDKRRDDRKQNDSRGGRDSRDHRRAFDFEDARDGKNIQEEIRRSGDNRKKKREEGRRREEESERRARQEATILKITDVITPSDLATLMKQPVGKVISTCFNMGEMVSINQRLRSREVIEFVASEFGYQVEFISADEAIKIETEVDGEEDLMERPPVVTVMGHVDHGKTSLLDYIRKTNVIAGEAGGITQHIGAYNVTLENGRKITFIDTPGHEAFTAMRARGARITDIAIIIVAADDDVMPQTDEAISHAAAAGVPIVFAINKIDKPGANPEKVKESLANRNYLVEDWGGQYQSQDISAKKGIGVEELLEKVLLQADIMELKANPNRKAVGSVIESSLDKGRGYIATVLVQKGTLHIGDVVLAGTAYGRVKAMYNERNQKIQTAGPSEPVVLLGLNGAPQAGDEFHVFDEDREAREMANRRIQLIREQGVRTQKGMDLDEIARRASIGNFQEINLIVKGDVDGSIEALTDSFIKLSTPEIQINVIHKAVGQISESDVDLAVASNNAMIIGFQVRPSSAARKSAEAHNIAIHTYSIIYDAIEELKSAMEGMLAPVVKEEVSGVLEVRQTFRISKIGTIAGCMVKEGKIKRSCQVRVIRDGIVVHTGSLASLKREKDDVREVGMGFECGVNLNSYNDIIVGDIIEAFEQVEVKKTL